MSDTDKENLKACLLCFYSSRDYIVKDELGQGSYGKVHVVYDKKSKKELAAKVVTKPTPGEQFLWPQIRHLNLLKLIRTDNLMYESVIYLMPYIGDDLFRVLYERIPEFHSDKRCFVRKKWYIMDVLKGLEYLHRKTYCQLDLKEENIMVCSKTDIAIIGDFSTLSTSDKAHETRFGLNPLSLPPEVASESKSRKFDGVAAEMWTYGILVLQVFTKQCLCRLIKDRSSYDNDIFPVVILSTRKNVVQQSFNRLHRKAWLPINACRELLEFVNMFLVEDPLMRASAKGGLEHSFFESDVLLQHDRRDFLHCPNYESGDADWRLEDSFISSSPRNVIVSPVAEKTPRPKDNKIKIFLRYQSAPASMLAKDGTFLYNFFMNKKSNSCPRFSIHSKLSETLKQRCHNFKYHKITSREATKHTTVVEGEGKGLQTTKLNYRKFNRNVPPSLIVEEVSEKAKASTTVDVPSGGVFITRIEKCFRKYTPKFKRIRGLFSQVNEAPKPTPSIISFQFNQNCCVGQGDDVFRFAGAGAPSVLNLTKRDNRNRSLQRVRNMWRHFKNKMNNLKPKRSDAVHLLSSAIHQRKS